MKKIVYYASTLILVGMTLVSCEKDFVVTENQTAYQNDLITAKLTEFSYPWGNYNPEDIGYLHNYYSQKVIEYLENNPNATLVGAIENVDIQNISLEEKQRILSSVSNVSEEEMKEQIISSLKSPRAIELFNEIDYSVDNSSDYNTLNYRLGNIRDSINLEFSDTDKDILLVYLETINSSAYFWYPIELGGSGLGDSYRAKASNGQNRELPGWVKADGRGVGYGMTGWALTGGLGGPFGFLGATV